MKVLPGTKDERGSGNEKCKGQTQNTPSAAGQKKKRYRRRNRNKNKVNATTTTNATNIQNLENPPQQSEQLKEQDVHIETLTLVQSAISETNEQFKKEGKAASSTLKKNANKSVVEQVCEVNQPVCFEMKSSSLSAAATADVAKSREQILAEREAKKLAKQATKLKKNIAETSDDNTAKRQPSLKSPQISIAAQNKLTTPISTSMVQAVENPIISIASAQMNVSNKSVDTPQITTEKTREQIKAEREAKKQAKHAAKTSKTNVSDASAQQIEIQKIAESNRKPAPDAEEKKKPVLSKAERRAIQDAQRAAKAQKSTNSVPMKTNAATLNTKATTNTTVTAISSKPNLHLNSTTSPNKSTTSQQTPSAVKALKTSYCNVKLFNHLESARQDVSLFVNNSQIHPGVVQLGEQYAKRTVVGSNARCIAFLNALKKVIQDFQTPPKKEFARSLEASITNCIEYLQKCRPLAVSVSNAYKHIKHMLTQLPTDKSETVLKENLCHFIETYIENQIEKAAQAISSSVQEKISNGDVILTFGCSSLINYICEEAQRRQVDFRVIVVDSRPFCEGQELLRRLTVKEIPCTYVLINAVGFVMPEVTKVLLGAHALLSNGYVMARTGTAQVALVARSFNVPVLVCCETHKFSERFQTDAIVYNELGNPDDLILSDKCCLTNWQTKNKMTPLNLMYDITPPELVTAVVTEVSILPCTSVPVILRIKPTEIGYYS